MPFLKLLPAGQESSADSLCRRRPCSAYWCSSPINTRFQRMFRGGKRLKCGGLGPIRLKLS